MARLNGITPYLSSSSPGPEAVKSLSTDQASTMVTLAQKIAKETENLEAYMKANGLPMPSFDVDAPGDFPKLPEDIQKCRREIICLTKDLRALVVGPRESVSWGVWEVSYCTARKRPNPPPGGPRLSPANPSPDSHSTF
jgi:hypothetical protein